VSAAALVKSTGPRVLVVEDEAMVAMMLEDMLLDLGCAIVSRNWKSRVTAATLQAGLTLARAAAIDAAVLDVNLSGDKAFPIADALAERGVPFVYATGYGRAGLRAEDAARVVVQKPYSLDDLARHLRAAGVLPPDDGPEPANAP
jgi:CheY-like chemotaxis protein